MRKITASVFLMVLAMVVTSQPSWAMGMFKKKHSRGGHFVAGHWVPDPTEEGDSFGPDGSGAVGEEDFKPASLDGEEPHHDDPFMREARKEHVGDDGPGEEDPFEDIPGEGPSYEGSRSVPLTECPISDTESAVPVPEPMSLSLMGMGLAGVILKNRKR